MRSAERKVLSGQAHGLAGVHVVLRPILETKGFGQAAGVLLLSLSLVLIELVIFEIIVKNMYVCRV